MVLMSVMMIMIVLNKGMLKRNDVDYTKITPLYYKSERKKLSFGNMVGQN